MLTSQIFSKRSIFLLVLLMILILDIKRISKSDAIYFKTIDDFRQRKYLLEGYDLEHKKDLNVLNEMVARIEGYYKYHRFE